MSKPLSELAADAREALDSMDDFARMDVGVDAHGPRGVLDRFIAAAEDLARRVEGAAAASVTVTIPAISAGGYASEIDSVRPVKSIGVPVSSVHVPCTRRHSPLLISIALLIARWLRWVQ